MADPAFRPGKTPTYAPLSEQAARRIVEASLQILRETGVGFEPDPEVLDLFAGAGCDVSRDGLVKFPPERVRAALASVAKRVTLWNRAGTEGFEIRDGETRFFPGMTAIKVVDIFSGAVRSSTRDDVALIARVADSLPHIDGVCLPCKIVERSNLHGEMEEFAVLAANTAKPLEYLCENAEALDAAIEMASAIRGGADRLAEKPYFLQIVTPLPLYYAKMHTDQILRAARAGVPVSSGTVNIGGASSPITIAGNMAHGLATDMAAIVLGQLAREGSFCIGSTDVGFMDPATGGIGGFSQIWLADQAMCQIRRMLGLPSLTGIGGLNRARGFNQTALSYLSASMLQTFHSRPATCDYLGLVEGGLTYSLHSLLFCHDLVGMLRTLWQGIRVDDETLALELTHELGPRGNFLAQRHTARFCRAELWRSRYLHNPNPVAVDEPELMERIGEDVREIAAAHRPEPLAEPLAKELQGILERRMAEHPV